MMTLEPHKMYRIAYNADDAHLRGKLVVFLEYVDRPSFDVRRARVALISDDGGIYYVKPSLLIAN